MKILSSAFQNNQYIPSKYTCQGQDINPPLKFSEIPDNAKSLVVICDDPDAPSKTWVHWLVFNIDPKETEIKEGSKFKTGIEDITDFGRAGYGGPCPPSGKHRYFFKLYALDIVLNIDGNVKKENIEEAMEGHILEKAELIGLFQKK